MLLYIIANHSIIDMFSREQIADVFTSHLIEDRGVIITTHQIGDIEHLIEASR